ncbi:MAG: TIR domain-containing protein [Saprospiraceae bacterium]|nr:TIR domain-containing protein [Saprospiraceae bacterium]
MEPVRLFISYSERDLELKDHIKELLTPLVNNHSLSIWDELDIKAGEVRADIISAQLNSADIILLLLSASSLANHDFYNNQLSPSIARHNERKALIVPVLLSLCHYDITPLAGLQLLPKNKRPVTEQNVQQSLFEVTLYIKEEVRAIQKRKTFLQLFEEAEQLFRARQWNDAKTAFHQLEQKYPFRDYPGEIRHIRQRIEACLTEINFKPPVNKKPQKQNKPPKKKPTPNPNPAPTPPNPKPRNPNTHSQDNPPFKWPRYVIFGVTGLVLLLFAWYLFSPSKPNEEELAIANARREDRMELWLEFKSKFPKSKYAKDVVRSIDRHDYRDFFLKTLSQFKNFPEIDLRAKLLEPSLEKFPEDSLFYYKHINPIR